MSGMSSASTPVLVIGRLREVALSMAEKMSPQFSFPGIIDAANYSPEAVRTVLTALNPTPAGVMVGGGVSEEIQNEVKKVVEDFNSTGQHRVKYLAVPVGIRDQVGPEGHVSVVKDILSKEFSAHN